MNKNILNKILIVFMLFILTINILPTNIEASVKDDLVEILEEDVDTTATADDRVTKKLEEYKALGIINDEVANAQGIFVNNLSGTEDAEKREEFDNAFNNFVQTYNEAIYYLLAFSMMSSFLIFIIIFLRLTFLPAHPQDRRKAMIDIVVSGISTALLGSVAFIVKLYYSSFSSIIDNQVMLHLNWKATAAILLYEFRVIIVGIFGIATLTTIAMFIRALLMLAGSASNPSQRATAKTNLLFTIAGAAGLGSITFFVGLFTGMFR